MGDLITTNEAARRLGVTRQRIWAMIKAGQLQATRIGRDWLIDATALDQVSDRKPGRPALDKLTPAEYRRRGLEVVAETKPPILRCPACGETWRGWSWRCPNGCNAETDSGAPELAE